VNISDILKLWRVEKGSAQLAQLPSNFFVEAKKLTEMDNPYEVKKAKDLYTDIVHMRQHKMLMSCLRHLQGGDKPQNLLAAEKAIYNNIFSQLQAMRLGEVKVVIEEPKEDKEVEAQEVSIPEEKPPEEPGQEKISGEQEEKISNEHEVPAEELEEGTPEETEEGTTEEPKAETKEEAVEETKEEPEEIKDESSEAKEEPPEEPKEEPVEAKEVEEEPKELTKEEKPEEKPEEPKEEVKAEEKIEEKPKEEGKEEVFKAKTENKGLRQVKFVKPMPAFVGPDLEIIGPFDEEQIIELDPEIVEILLKNEAVELA